MKVKELLTVLPYSKDFDVEITVKDNSIPYDAAHNYSKIGTEYRYKSGTVDSELDDAVLNREVETVYGCSYPDYRGLLGYTIYVKMSVNACK